MTEQPKAVPSAIVLAEEPTVKSELVINDKARAMFAMLKSCIVNGQKLSPDEVISLSYFAVRNDLNPLDGECYFMPGAGAIWGINGRRKKCDIRLQDEARKAGVDVGSYRMTFREPTPQEKNGIKDFHPEKGDMAIVGILKDNVSDKVYAHEFSDMVKEFRDSGIDADTAITMAGKICGEPPSWTGVACLYANEKFAKDGYNEKMTREERLNKRAESICLKKRFPQTRMEDGISPADMAEYNQYAKSVIVSPEYREAQNEYKKLEPPTKEAVRIVTALLTGEPKPEPSPSEKLEVVDGDVLGFNRAGLPIKDRGNMEPEVVKMVVEAIANESEPTVLLTGQVGLLIGAMERDLGGTENRRNVMQYLFGKSSIRDLDGQQQQALLKWYQPEQTTNGATGHPNSVNEAKAILAIAGTGQMALPE